MMSYHNRLAPSVLFSHSSCLSSALFLTNMTQIINLKSPQCYLDVVHAYLGRQKESKMSNWDVSLSCMYGLVRGTGCKEQS